MALHGSISLVHVSIEHFDWSHYNLLHISQSNPLNCLNLTYLPHISKTPHISQSNQPHISQTIMLPFLHVCVRHHFLGTTMIAVLDIVLQIEVLQKWLPQKMARSLKFVLRIQQMSHLKIFLFLYKLSLFFSKRKLLFIQICGQSND